MEIKQSTLATRLREALERKAMTSLSISEQTRIPQTTVQALIGEDVNAVLPPRVYLRGHAGLLADELGIDRTELLDLFDQKYPEMIEADEVVHAPRIPVRMVAVAAAMSGVGILAIILAFAR